MNKALEKDRDMRYQHAADMRTDLKRLQREGDSGRSSASARLAVDESRAAAAPRPAALARKWYLVLAACAALLAAGLAADHFLPRAKSPSGPAKITQISEWNKSMYNARLAPDGHAVVFVSPVDGVGQLELMLTSGGEPLQLTKDAGNKWVDNFSPDGKEIYYANDLGPNVISAVPTLGGAPRRVVSGFFGVPSPDGVHIYYAKSDRGGIFRAEKSGLNEELVYNSEGSGLTYIPLLPYPGGNELLAVGVRGDADKGQFYRINVAKHQAVDLGEGELSDNPFDIQWNEPGKSALFSRTANGLTNIWSYSLQEHSLTQLTFGTGPDPGPCRTRAEKEFTLLAANPPDRWPRITCRPKKLRTSSRKRPRSLRSRQMESA